MNWTCVAAICCLRILPTTHTSFRRWCWQQLQLQHNPYWSSPRYTTFSPRGTKSSPTWTALLYNVLQCVQALGWHVGARWPLTTWQDTFGGVLGRASTIEYRFKIALFASQIASLGRAGTEIAPLETGRTWLFYFILVSVDRAQIVFR